MDMSNNYALIVFGMFIVTFIPRLIPMVTTQNMQLPSFLKRWLQCVPYAALGALIFPGILSVDPSRWWLGAIGGCAAIILALVQRNVIVVVLGAILVMVGLQAIYYP